MLSLLFNGPSESSLSVLFTGFGFYLTTIIFAILFSLIYNTENTSISNLTKNLVEYGRNGYLVLAGLLAVIFPVAEEILFRILPYIMMLFVAFTLEWTGIAWIINLVIAIVATVIWTTAHGKRAIVLIPVSIFYLVLLYNGLIIEALIFHIQVNSLATMAVIVQHKVKHIFNEKQSNSENAPVDAPALPEPTTRDIIRVEIKNEIFKK